MNMNFELVTSSCIRPIAAKAVGCLYIGRSIIGIVFCYHTDGPISCVPKSAGSREKKY